MSSQARAVRKEPAAHRAPVAHRAQAARGAGVREDREPASGVRAEDSSTHAWRRAALLLPGRAASKVGSAALKVRSAALKVRSVEHRRAGRAPTARVFAPRGNKRLGLAARLLMPHGPEAVRKAQVEAFRAVGPAIPQCANACETLLRKSVPRCERPGRRAMARAASVPVRPGLSPNPGNERVANIITLRGVTKTYGTGIAAFQALKGVDVDIREGDFVAVMGPSGSGKSTMMNILGCLDVPSAGTFEFKGFHVENLDRDQRALLRRRYLGFVFQGFNLLARTTALENVELPLLYRGEDKKVRHTMGMAALEKVGLAEWWDHTPAELSGGQQQRVAIARALVTNPAVLLADEPTGNLDTERSLEIMELLTDLNQTSGITVLMVTHESEMAAYAHTIIHFKDGLVDRVQERAVV